MKERPRLTAPAARAIVARCLQTHPRVECVCVVTMHEPARSGADVHICPACAQAAYAAQQLSTTAERRRP